MWSGTRPEPQHKRLNHDDSSTNVYDSASGFIGHHMKHDFIHDFLLKPAVNEPDPEIPIGHDIGQVCLLGHDAKVQRCIFSIHSMPHEMFLIILSNPNYVHFATTQAVLRHIMWQIEAICICKCSVA